jgi:N12 class adenine-specific DNA methylase
MAFQKLYNETNLKAYTDRIDVNEDISLHEYGIIRNPKNDRTIFCTNPNVDYPEKSYRYEYVIDFISLQDVKEVLEDINKGFFDFIGSDRETEIEQLYNDNLAYMIFSINQYDGSFTPYYY